MSKIINYLKDTKAEFQHVSWPSKKQSIAFTVVVIVIAIATAIYLGVFDYLFSLGVKNIIQ